MVKLSIAFVSVGVLFAQETVDHSSALKVIPWTMRYDFPGKCSPSQRMTLITGSYGSNDYVCGLTNNWIQITGGGGGGGGTPGGSDTQVQFNDAGSFGGNSGFTFNKSTGNVAIGTRVLAQGSDGYVDPLLAAKAPLVSPAFTGNPTAPTQASGDNSTNLANTAFVTAATLGSAMPRANLAVEYTLDDAQGAYAGNTVYPRQPNLNLIGPSEQNFAAWGGGSAATDNYATDPNGNFTASRLVLASGGFFYLINNFPYVNGQQYTLSIYVKSNTGVAQAVRMSTPGLSFSSDIVVPATTWARISTTFTASGSGYVLPIKTDVAADAIDIQIWGAQLEIGAHPTPYIPQYFFAQLGGAPQTTASQPTWTAAGLDFTANSGHSYAQAFSWQPLDLSRITVYAVVRWSASPVSSTFSPIVSNPYATSSSFSLTGNYSANTTATPAFVFGGTTSTAYSTDLNDSNWHILTGSYDGTNVNVYLDGYLVAFTAATLTPVQVTQMFLSNFNNAAYWPGQIGYVGIYSVAHSAATVLNSYHLLSNLMAQRGVTVSTVASSKYVAFVGNSICDPATNGNTNIKYPWLTVASFTPPLIGMNFCVTGTGLTQMVAAEATVNAQIVLTRTKNVLVVMSGNELAGDGTAYEAAMKAYCLTQRAAGWKIVLLTILPRTTTGYNASRNAANTLARADTSFYDVLADVGADATVGCDSCAGTIGSSAASTYYLDGVHPNATGHALIAPIVEAAIASIY